MFSNFANNTNVLVAIYIRPIEIKVLSVASIALWVHDLTLTQSSRVQSPASAKQKVQLMEFARGIKEIVGGNEGYLYFALFFFFHTFSSLLKYN